MGTGLSDEARQWRERLQCAMALPYDPAAQAEIHDGWLRLRPVDRLAFLGVLSGAEEGWLSAAGRGVDPATEPRARSAAATADGVRFDLHDGREVLVPWHVSTALEAADSHARGWIELREDGRVLWWPATEDVLRVATLLAVHGADGPGSGTVTDADAAAAGAYGDGI